MKSVSIASSTFSAFSQVHEYSGLEPHGHAAPVTGWFSLAARSQVHWPTGREPSTMPLVSLISNIMKEEGVGGTYDTNTVPQKQYSRSKPCCRNTGGRFLCRRSTWLARRRHSCRRGRFCSRSRCCWGGPLCLVCWWSLRLGLMCVREKLKLYLVVKVVV